MNVDRGSINDLQAKLNEIEIMADEVFSEYPVADSSVGAFRYLVSQSWRFSIHKAKEALKLIAELPLQKSEGTVD